MARTRDLWAASSFARPRSFRRGISTFELESSAAIYDKCRSYPLHGEEAVNTVQIFGDRARAEREVQELNSACEYSKGHDLHESWVMVEMEVE